MGQSQKELMAKFLNKLKKKLFLVDFLTLMGHFLFINNPVLSRTTSHGLLTSCQSFFFFKKNSDPILRKRLQMDERTDRWKDGQSDPILWDPSGYRRGSHKTSPQILQEHFPIKEERQNNLRYQTNFVIPHVKSLKYNT